MYYLIAAVLVIGMTCIGSFVAGALWLKVRRYLISSDKIDGDGITRLVVVTDLHERSYGKDNVRLIEKVEELSPDAILIGGDIADSYGKVGGSYMPLFEALPRLAPTFMVLGNHEFSARRDLEVAGYAEKAGIRVLNDEFEPFDCNGNVINIIGMTDYLSENVVYKTLEERLDEIMVPYYGEKFDLVLCHRPCEVEAMSKKGVDLMVCGHTHGGQMRLPFVGGVFTPSSIRLFPKYDMGHFKIRKMNLVISAGLGASTIPLRLFNRPEVTVIDIVAKK
ncbi:MAG: metallophosphoesterase [Clostridia bacterium]|nr:metallophosphoesterase [Clostridia bacterium]